MQGNNLKSNRKEFMGCYNRRLAVSLSVPREHTQTSQTIDSAKKSSEKMTEKKLKLNPIKNRTSSPTPSVLSERTYQSIQSCTNGDSCHCDRCLYDKQINTLTKMKPTLRLKSIYGKDFRPKESMGSTVVVAKETDNTQDGYLDLRTIYLKDYQVFQADKVEKYKPKDVLKFEGPCQQLSSYAHLYPGHRGANQYVKPVDKVVRDKFPLAPRTIYASQYTGRSTTNMIVDRYKDELKTGAVWVGESTYDNAYRSPNPESYSTTHVKNIEVFNESPSSRYQFNTIYRNEFQDRPSDPTPPSKHQKIKKNNKHSHEKAEANKSTPKPHNLSNRYQL